MLKKRVFKLAGTFFLVFISIISLHAQWAKTYGGSGDDAAHSIQQTSDGGFIVAGSTSSFGAGLSDFWVLKLNLAGNIEWQRSYGGSEEDVAYSVQETSDKGYIIAGSSNSFGTGLSDFWVLKLSQDGDIEWQRSYGGSGNDAACSVQQTSDGGYIVGGYTKSLQPGMAKFWVLKLSSKGSVEWQRAYGGGIDDYLVSLQQTSDLGFVAAGYSSSFGAGAYKFWILKLSSTGQIDWQRAYGGSGEDMLRSLQQTSDKGYIAAGSSSSFGAGMSDFWVLKLSQYGTVEWQRSYGGSGNDMANSIQQTSGQGYIVAGYTTSFGYGESDSWILKLSSTGAIEWQKTYGGSTEDNLSSIQQTGEGGYIAAGLTGSFGAGDSDMFILKLYSSGAIDPSCELPGSSNAAALNTSASYPYTFGALQDTGLTAQDTNISPIETDAILNVICETQLAISGTIKDDKGKAIEGVTVSFSNGGGEVKTDSKGLYSKKVSYGWSGEATPSKPGYIFSPSSRSYTDVSVNQADQDYTATLVHTISGSVKTAGGQGVQGVFITFGNQGGTANTDSKGYYSQTVKDGWSGITTPSKPGYTFSPSDRTYLNVTSDQTNQDYTAFLLTYKISGTVRLASSSEPLSGVVMNGLPSNPATNASGYYEAIVSYGWSSTVAPTRERYVFSPSQRIYRNVTSDMTDQDYAAYPGWLISGSMKTSGGNAMASVSISFSSEGGSAMTDSSGNYSQTVREGWSGTATPSTYGYTFSPSSRDYNNVTSDLMSQDYSGQPISYSMILSADSGGTTQPSPGSYSYDFGTQVSITAAPNSGYSFYQWSGNVASGHEKDNPVNIIVYSNLSIKANFERKALCFIATAAFDSPLNPKVRILRDFRDRYLIPSRLGQRMVDFYYRHSPKIASLVAKHKALKLVVRLSLLPFIAFSYSMLRFGPAMTAAMLLVISAILAVWIWNCWRRVKRNRRSKFIQKGKRV
jgi:uncharacterized delta-60 repeat protein